MFAFLGWNISKGSMLSNVEDFLNYLFFQIHVIMTEEYNQYIDQISLARTEIKNLRQQISALKHEHLKEIKHIKATLHGLRCANCGDTATTVATASHKDLSPSSSQEGITFRPIGVIESLFQNKRGVPRQPSVMANAHGAVIIDTGVFNNPEHALDGLEEFSHIWIIFHFHQTDSNNVPAKVAPPRLGGERRGVFATRSPHRPCPIGLSLVKIHSVEGNRINFLGVDMVNGTPVLDIKPYIPQYDYPATVDPLSTMARPPTEGISDAAEAVVNMTLDDRTLDGSLSPRVTNPIGINTSSPSPSPFEDIPSPGTNILTPISPSPESPISEDLLRNRTPLRRPDAERGAPDGQERFTPPQSVPLTNTDGIRIASWISNPPSQAYEVRFTEDALNRLNELIGDLNRAQAFKANLESLLSDDPRSLYVKTRYPDHEYSCVLEDLSISCVFDAGSSVCTIIALRSADEMQSN